MSFGEIQEMILELSKSPKGVNSIMVVEAYGGNKKVALATIKKLVYLKMIKKIEGSGYPEVYKYIL